MLICSKRFSGFVFQIGLRSFHRVSPFQSVSFPFYPFSPLVDSAKLINYIVKLVAYLANLRCYLVVDEPVS